MMAASITTGKAIMMSQILMVAASSARSWSFLSKFWSSLAALQWAAVISAAILAIGAVIEYWAKIKLLVLLEMKYLLGRSTPFDRCVFRKAFIHSAGPILVVLGIAGEVVFEGRAFILEDRQEEQARQIVGSLSVKAEAAETKAQSAIDKSSLAENKADGAQGKADKATFSALNALALADRAQKEEKQLRADLEKATADAKSAQSQLEKALNEAKAELESKTQELHKENLQLEESASQRDFRNPDAAGQRLSLVTKTGDIVAFVEYVPETECQITADEIVEVLGKANWILIPAAARSNPDLGAFERGVIVRDNTADTVPVSEEVAKLKTAADALVDELNRTHIMATRRSGFDEHFPQNTIIVRVGPRESPELERIFLEFWETTRSKPQ